MATRQSTVRLPERSWEQVSQLAKIFGDNTKVFLLAIDRLYQQEVAMSSHDILSDSDLYDLFVAPGTTYLEVSRMGRALVEHQIAEMRQDNPDGISLSDAEIALRVIDYARDQHLDISN